MVKEVGPSLEEYMNNEVVEEDNPFYIRRYNATEGLKQEHDYWLQNGNELRLSEGYGASYSNDDSADYFVVAVKAGFTVDIALRSSSMIYFNGFEFSDSYDRVTIGNDQFLRFTMTGGGFLEISGVLDSIFGDVYANDFSILETQLSNDAMTRLLLEEPQVNDRVRFSHNGYELYTAHGIGTGAIIDPYLGIILDGVTRIGQDVVDDTGHYQGVEDVQSGMQPEGEDRPTRDDVGTWELIHDRYGHKWWIVELNSPTDNNTWAFYFDGALESAFADKNDSLKALNQHYDATIRFLESKEVVKYDYELQDVGIFSFFMIMGARWLGMLL